jgi:hypothetical protein
MKNIKKAIIIILVLAILFGCPYLNIGQSADRVNKFLFTHITTWSKTVVIKEMTVEKVENDDVVNLDDGHDTFIVIDSRFDKGDIVEVGLDTMGTASPIDDIVVWTIKK